MAFTKGEMNSLISLFDNFKEEILAEVPSKKDIEEMKKDILDLKDGQAAIRHKLDT